MAYKLTVKVGSNTQAWALFMDARPIQGYNRDGEVLLTLAPGVRRLTYDVRGPGGKISLDLEGHPPIQMPSDGEWPFEVAVAANETFALDALYFRIGDEA